MSRRVSLVMACLWATAMIVAAVLDAPPGLVSMLPVIGVVTLLPDARRCA